MWMSDVTVWSLLCFHEWNEKHTYTSSDLVSTIGLQQAAGWKEEGGQSSTFSFSMQTWTWHHSRKSSWSSSHWDALLLLGNTTVHHITSHDDYQQQLRSANQKQASQSQIMSTKRLFLVRLSSLYCEQMTRLFQLIHTNMKMINRLFLFVFPQQSLDDWQVISCHTGGTFLHDGSSWQSAAVSSVWGEFTAASCLSFSWSLQVFNDPSTAAQPGNTVNKHSLILDPNWSCRCVWRL